MCVLPLYVVDSTACNLFFMNIYCYIEIKYFEDFVTMEIVLVPSNIVEGTNMCGGVRTTLME